MEEIPKDLRAIYQNPNSGEKLKMAARRAMTTIVGKNVRLVLAQERDGDEDGRSNGENLLRSLKVKKGD